jgi:hypothetical protein
MNETFFSGVKGEEIVARYYDWMLLAADFPAPMANVQKVLPSDRLKPVQITPGMAKISLWAMKYRQIDCLAPYNEFGIMIPVLYKRADAVSELPGFYAYHLPVTTKEARDGGVIYYGYPKFVAQISFDHDGESHRCRVQAAGKDIITLEVKQSATVPQSWTFYTYTVKDNQLLRTLIQVQGQSGTTTVKGGASYNLGDHPIAEELQALEMDGASTGHQYAPQLQSILYLAGERLPL